MRVLDFRSDTVTKPTAAMYDAMMAASLGDDVFGDDPTVNSLERKAAEMFGKTGGNFLSLRNNDQSNRNKSPYFSWG